MLSEYYAQFPNIQLMNSTEAIHRWNETCSLLVLISFTHFRPKRVSLSLLSSTQTSPCRTMWDSPVSLLSWSTRTTTAPSSASRCTTSASLKARRLAPRCSKSWWVSLWCTFSLQQPRTLDFMQRSFDLPVLIDSFLMKATVYKFFFFFNKFTGEIMLLAELCRRAF